MHSPEEVNALEDAYQLGEWEVYPQLNLLVSKGHKVHAEPKVMDVLNCLVQAQGRLVSREELLQRVWPRVVVNEEVLTRAISELRSLLGDTSRERRYIATLPKRGYRLLQTAVPLPTEQPHSQQEAQATASDHVDPLWQRLRPGRGAAMAASLALPVVAWLWFMPPAGEQQAAHPDYPEARRELVSELEALRSQLVSQSVAGISEPTQILLMPLVAITDDPQTQAFAAGLDQDLQDVLFQHTALEVLYYAADNAPSVDVVLSGSVRIYRGQARISLQLVEAAGSRLLWTRTFECVLDDPLATQARIARRIGEVLASAHTV